MTSDAGPAADPPRARWARLGRPGVIAALWVLATFVHIAGELLLPGDDSGWRSVSSVLFLASVPVLAAFVAAAFARSRDSVFLLSGALLLIWLGFSLAEMLARLALGPRAAAADWALLLLILVSLAVAAGAMLRIMRGHGVPRRRRWASAAAALSVLIAWPALSLFDEQFARLSGQFAARDEPSDVPPEIDEERLWTAQPGLVDAALAQLPEPSPAPEVFVVAVGAGGIQDLFGREARKAREVLARTFQAGPRSIVLANDQASLSRAPLATNTNLRAVLASLGKRADPHRDLVIIYLTAHGSRNAELQTDLPDYTDLNAIGAKTLAAALAKARIRRRVVIVSACYSGSWIKPLASDDTIVVTAARSDRTSFGCSDDRELTFFGEALLTGSLARGASLADGFRAARRTVTRWEEGSENPHSEPQAFIGKNMAVVWNGTPAVPKP